MNEKTEDKYHNVLQSNVGIVGSCFEHAGMIRAEPQILGPAFLTGVCVGTTAGPNMRQRLNLRWWPRQPAPRDASWTRAGMVSPIPSRRHDPEATSLSPLAEAP